jgi:hypothetical protein
MVDNNAILKNNSEILKPLAFKPLGNRPGLKNDNLEIVFDDSLTNESHSYDEYDFVLAREFSGIIRDDNPVKLLTMLIIQTYKKCRNDFQFEDTMKPRRELTVPSEGIIQLTFRST